MFPLAVQYFRPETGICNKMLDFGENADESAAGIIDYIEQSLEKFGLSLDQVTAYSADNTNVNYGIHNSVFTNLKKMQKGLLEGNCHAHIVHNTVKHALDQLSVDVENVVLKVYGHFSTSAKRRESLKEFCQFMLQQGGFPSIQLYPVLCNPGLLSGLISSAWGKNVPDRSELC